MEKQEHICQKLQKEAYDTSIYEQAKEYAVDYVKNVYERDVIPTADAIKNLAFFEEELPQEGADSAQLLKMLHNYGSPATLAQTGGRYFGFVNGGAVPAALAAKWMSDVWDQNAVLYCASPIASTLENLCEKWLVELFGLPQGTAAGFVSGSSTATLCGLVAARNFLLKRAGYDVAKKGLFHAPEIRVVISEEAHSSVFKALSILGLGSERIEKIPADENGSIDAAKVPMLDEHTLLILQAGNVHTGAFDDFDVLCKKGKAAGAWVHIDGAFGLWAAASSRFEDVMKSMNLADSWSCDAHKTLNAPYDNGIILCRHREALLDALQMEGAYIVYSEKRDNMLTTLDMSRRARGVELWATLKALGKRGVAQLVENLHDKAQYFASSLKEKGFEVLNEVCFNQVVISVGDEAAQQSFLSGIQSSGVCWCGGSRWKGKPVVRISVCSYRTTLEDIDLSVEAFVKVRERCGN